MSRKVDDTHTHTPQSTPNSTSATMPAPAVSTCDSPNSARTLASKHCCIKSTALASDRQILGEWGLATQLTWLLLPASRFLGRWNVATQVSETQRENFKAPWGELANYLATRSFQFFFEFMNRSDTCAQPSLGGPASPCSTVQPAPSTSHARCDLPHPRQQ